MTSLAAFAAAQPNPNGKCRICALDAKILKQVRDGHESGVTAVTISKWLTAETGERISDEAVRRHLRSHS